jgi:hypothetical protein
MHVISLHLILHIFEETLMWWELNFNAPKLNRALVLQSVQMTSFLYGKWAEGKVMHGQVFRLQKKFNPINSTTFVLFDKYCPTVDQLGSKDSSRDFQLNWIISYFFTYIYYFIHGSKDWCDEESKKISTFKGHQNKAYARMRNWNGRGEEPTRGHSHVSDEHLALEIILPVFLSGSFRTPLFFSNRPVAGKIKQF